jgi:hypothetical protein
MYRDDRWVLEAGGDQSLANEARFGFFTFLEEFFHRHGTIQKHVTAMKDAAQPAPRVLAGELVAAGVQSNGFRGR